MLTSLDDWREPYKAPHGQVCDKCGKNLYCECELEEDDYEDSQTK